MESSVDAGRFSHPYEGPPSIGYLTHWATRYFARMIDRQLRSLGITSSQLGPMLIMAREGPTLQRDLVWHSAIGQPAMVSTLRILEKGGFVTRRNDENDKRAVIFELTPDGEALVKEAVPVLKECNRQAIKGLSKSEQSTLVKLMERVIVNISDDA